MSDYLFDYLEITIARKPRKIKGFQWSIRDSNPWPPQCECGALPAALIPQNLYDLENRMLRFSDGNNGARTHDLPLVRRALSQLSYVSVLSVLHLYC